MSEFGNSHRQQFPVSSPAGQAFAAVAAAAAKFDTHASARRLAGEDSRKVKANVSRAIRRRLTLVARAARLVAASTPDDLSRFALPAGQTVEALLTAARVFVRDGQAHLERFVPLGVPPTIVADLQALVSRFDEADRAWRAGQAGRTAAEDGINEAIKAGLDALSGPWTSSSSIRPTTTRCWTRRGGVRGGPAAG